MKLFEGKSPAERNKIIAAIVLGVMAVVVLRYTYHFRRQYFSAGAKFP